MLQGDFLKHCTFNVKSSNENNQITSDNFVVMLTK